MKLSSRKIDPKIIEKYEFTIGNVQGVMVDPNTCEPFLAIQIQVTNKHRSTTTHMFVYKEIEELLQEKLK
jgi:hypothetical protein